MIKLNNDNFETEVMEPGVPVLVDFFATWCGPCKMLSPVLEEISHEVTDFKMAKVDVDEAPELAEKYSIMSVPTLLVLKDGEIVSKSVGAQPKSVIIEMINDIKQKEN